MRALFGAAGQKRTASGKNNEICQRFLRKYSSFVDFGFSEIYLTGDPNQFYVPRVSSRTRGVSRSSQTRDGMRWTRQRRRDRRVAGQVSCERAAGARTNGA